MDINKLLELYPTDKEIDVICVETIEGLTFGKKYKASLINSAFLPVHWEVNDEIVFGNWGQYKLCALEYLIPIAEWRNDQIDKIVK